MTPWLPLQPSKEEIRLLSLEPAEDDTAPVVCNMRTISLVNHYVDYEALSYVWGRSSDDSTITLCGQEQSITDNLFTGLKHLRHENASRTLWVDAVCINQADPDERESQVGLMGRIYSKAKGVVVWLGSHGTSTEWVNEVSSICLKSKSMVHFDKFPMYLFGMTMRGQWWARAWTLQEAVFARTLTFHAQSTEKTVTVDDLETFEHELYTHFLRAPQPCCREVLYAGPVDGLVERTRHIILDLLERRRGVAAGERFDILDLAFTYNARSATQARDRIFAYAGLARHAPAELINYKSSLIECLVQCAKILIESTHGPEVLLYVTHPAPRDIHRNKTYNERGVDERERLTALPSWCPDWTQQVWTENLDFERLRYASFGRFSAGLDTMTLQSHMMRVSPVKCLHTLAIICDIVEETDPYCELPGRLAPHVWSQWCTLVRQSVKYWPNVACDGCETRIWGKRYKCTECDDFDLCAICSKQPLENDPGHSFNEVVSEREHQKGSTSEQDASHLKWDHVEKATVQRLEDGQYIIEDAKWEELSMARYPFSGSEIETVQDAFRKTLLTDHRADTSSADGDEVSAKAIEVLAELTFLQFWCYEVEERPIVVSSPRGGFTREETGIMLSKVDSSYTAEIASIVGTMTSRRRLLITRSGYIGLGPLGMEPGDVIVVLPGARVPYVMRNIDTTTGADCDGEGYKYVGDAYVHGLMYGKAFDLEREGVFKRSNIVVH